MKFANDFREAHARSIRQRGRVKTWWLVFSALWRMPMFWLALLLRFVADLLMRGAGAE